MITLIQASESNPGLYMSDVDVARYGSRRNREMDKVLRGIRKFPVNRNHRILYDLADTMFMVTYQQHFDDIVVQ